MRPGPGEAPHFSEDPTIKVFAPRIALLGFSGIRLRNAQARP